MHAFELVQLEQPDSSCSERNQVWIQDRREFSNREEGRMTGKRRRSRKEGKRSCERVRRNFGQQRRKKTGREFSEWVHQNHMWDTSEREKNWNVSEWETDGVTTRAWQGGGGSGGEGGREEKRMKKRTGKVKKRRHNLNVFSKWNYKWKWFYNKLQKDGDNGGNAHLLCMRACVRACMCECVHACFLEWAQQCWLTSEVGRSSQINSKKKESTTKRAKTASRTFCLTDEKTI